MPKNCYFLRLNDPSSSFFQSDNLRFSPTNPFDYILYSNPFMYCLELKTTENSITYWKEEFEDKDKKKSFQIKKNQILGLNKASEYDGIISGFILNFRNVNKTYFLSIKDFNNMISWLNKKSINYSDIEKANGYLIEQKIKKVHYTYNLDKFISDITTCKGGSYGKTNCI